MLYINKHLIEQQINHPANVLRSAVELTQLQGERYQIKLQEIAYQTETELKEILAQLVSFEKRDPTEDFE